MQKVRFPHERCGNLTFWWIDGMALLPVRGHVGALLPAKPWFFVESRQHEAGFLVRGTGMLAPCCPQSLDSSSSHANTTWIFHAGGRVCWRLAARKALILRWVTPTWPRFFRLAGEYVGALLPAKPWFFVEPRQHDQDFSGRRGIMLAPCCSQSLNPSSSHANYVISFSWS